MKINYSILLIVAFCCIALAEDQVNHATSSGTEKTSLSARDSLIPAKLFNFDRFKSLFNKQYNSLTEQLARQKIFFANAFRAFLSLIGYKHYKQTCYLSVNERSDWTLDELRALDTRRPIDLDLKSEGETNLPHNDDDDDDDVDGNYKQQQIDQPATDVETIELKLKEILDQHSNEAGYAEIVAELQKNNNNKRKRRSINNKNRDLLSFDDLLDNVVDQQKVSPKLVKTVASNNPQYEAPELDSYGADDTDSSSLKPMNEETKSRILSDSGINVVGKFLTSSINSFLGIDEKVISKYRPKTPDEIYVDHRESNCMTPVKNQKSCGSCFIFSSVALYEWQYCKETGNLVGFSEQYPLDCGETSIGTRISCKGGQERTVGTFFYISGIELEKNYPYRYREDTCPYDKSTPIRKMGYLKVNEPKLKVIEEYQFDNYIKRMPILLGIGVSDNFHSYGGGVDAGESCDRKRGHSVLVVGAGIEDDIPYWLIRNSYGPYWGEKGYYKLAKRAKNCLLDRGVGFVLAPSDGYKVFGDINHYYDSAAVREHVANTRPSLNNLFNNINSFFAPKDPNIVTPPPF